mmetsp:Transcript_3496/g.8356  ORF Transcript_3496/g.8356 Transcript_3496/m.8356 type:complete len:255 (-) Transcript_3496:72-836(-)
MTFAQTPIWHKCLKARFGSGGNLLALIGGLTVNLHQLGDIELGSLQQLHLADVHVLERVDALASLVDVLANGLGDELLDQVLEVAGGGLLGDDLEHLPSDSADLGALCVASLLHLVLALLGEGNAVNAQLVVVSGHHVDVSLDESLPLLHQGAELVRGEVHAVEVGQAVLALHILDAELDLAETLILIVVKISEVALEDTALQVVRGDTGTRRASDEGLAHSADGEGRGSLNVIPVLLGERIDDLATLPLLALR